MGLTTYDDEFLLAAIVIISMALIFYSVGVWSERIQGRLKGWHVTAFGLGLVCDFVGTAFMAELVRLTGQDNRLHAVLGSIVGFLDISERFRPGETQFQPFQCHCLVGMADSLFYRGLSGNDGEDIKMISGPSNLIRKKER